MWTAIGEINIVHTHNDSQWIAEAYYTIMQFGCKKNIISNWRMKVDKWQNAFYTKFII